MPCAEIRERGSSQFLVAEIRHLTSNCFSRTTLIRLRHLLPLPRAKESPVEAERMAKNSSPASGKMKVRIPSRNHAVAGTGAGDGGIAATLAAGGGRLPSCFVEKIACDVAATPSSPERCGDFDCDEASQPPSRHLFYRAASQPAGAAASSRRMVGALAARCRLHWQPRWLPPPFQTGSIRNDAVGLGSAPSRPALDAWHQSTVGCVSVPLCSARGRAERQPGRLCSPEIQRHHSGSDAIFGRPKLVFCQDLAVGCRFRTCACDLSPASRHLRRCQPWPGGVCICHSL